MGPTALRIAGIETTLIELGNSVIDSGDLHPEPASDLPEHPKAHQLKIVGAFTRALEQRVHDVAAAGGFPLILGGDHSLSMGSVSGMARYAASVGRPLFVLWLDAHSDFNSPATSPSGNIHGMPVAFFCGQAEFADILRSDRPMVDPRHVYQVGIRSVDPHERVEIRQHGVNVFDMRSIDEQGVASIMRDILTTVVNANGLLHVSFDVDFLDPQIAPGVGTVIPGGPTYREAQLCMEMIADTGRMASLDVMELNPALDVRNQTAVLAVDLIESLFGKSTLMRR